MLRAITSSGSSVRAASGFPARKGISATDGLRAESFGMAGRLGPAKLVDARRGEEESLCPLSKEDVAVAFKIGDRLVYPNHGVGVVETIQESLLEGSTAPCYQLRLIGNNSRVIDRKSTRLN